YDSFYGAWPERAGDPMADKINSMRKVVVSTTLGSSPWTDTSVIAADVAAAIEAIKAEDGGPILVIGSRRLSHFLLAHGLVDTISLQVFPLILGSGARFYPDSADKLDLTLVSSRAIEHGVVIQSYSVNRG
ncbi:MAG: bifunctional deaminase-reductase domain protein, partial [Jatrophihabitantaceae bacterium]|nr:bifunctional deaminase-reductase domain protein [Jatrophihabitantaceae bacterium]